MISIFNADFIADIPDGADRKNLLTALHVAEIMLSPAYCCNPHPPLRDLFNDSDSRNIALQAESISKRGYVMNEGVTAQAAMKIVMGRQFETALSSLYETELAAVPADRLEKLRALINKTIAGTQKMMETTGSTWPQIDDYLREQIEQLKTFHAMLATSTTTAAGLLFRTAAP